MPAFCMAWVPLPTVSTVLYVLPSLGGVNDTLQSTWVAYA